MTQNNFFDSMLYHKIARDNSFCNELYPCAPIVRLVIFYKIFQQVNFKEICALIFTEAFPYLKRTLMIEL